ncbi:MAG: hypothetical protein ABSD13_00380 [Candidatus Korobacteraceae bacterium]|jgi:hypothetical protein
MMHGKLMPLALLAVALAATGCSVEKKGSNGNNEEVKIETPVGGVKVKTNDAAIAADAGLAVYPGATVVRNDRNNGAADVELSFGDFHLRVRALGYQTSDSPGKVSAFYRKELTRYGDVIECKDDRPVGTPSRTSEGLTCDEGKHIKINNVDRHAEAEIELKTGSKLHQHIVAIEPQSGGTKFGLATFDLPSEGKESN